jgi:8-amino-7-oxononanoate synthase
MLEIEPELQALERRGLLRSRRVLESAQRVHVHLEGQHYVSFASNDYLGLAADPRLVEALAEGARRYGVGAGASHLLTGHHRVHQQLEARLAEFVGLPRALLFGSGYCANLAVVTVLAAIGRQTQFFADRLNHASLNDGMLLSRARFRRYPHLDLETLRRLLGASRADNRVVLTDSVFSMDGDVAPLDRLAQLCTDYGAWLVIDDAHGFGLLGREGRGAVNEYRLNCERLVYMGTLGKAAGVSGAFVAAPDAFVELLIQRAHSYIYSTASSPALAWALLASIDIIEREQWRREQLSERITQLRSALAQCGCLLDSRTAIQPWIIGDAAEAVASAARLAESGLLVPAIRPPTVPTGSARLRISLSAAHRAEDVQRLVDALPVLAE